MAKYLLTYKGGSMPETEEEGAKVMAAWSSWLGGLGESLVEGGAPIGQARTIGSDGSVSDGGGADPVTGYSLVSADSLDNALSIAKGCPHLDAGGSVIVGETIEM